MSQVKELKQKEWMSANFPLQRIYCPICGSTLRFTIRTVVVACRCGATYRIVQEVKPMKNLEHIE
jgi:RNase P subunit RPR2